MRLLVDETISVISTIDVCRGVGYDIVHGNPSYTVSDNSFFDPGFRQAVLEFSFNENYQTAGNLVPVGANLKNRPVCQYSQTSTEVRTMGTTDTLPPRQHLLSPSHHVYVVVLQSNTHRSSVQTSLSWVMKAVTHACTHNSAAHIALCVCVCDIDMLASSSRSSSSRKTKRANKVKSTLIAMLNAFVASVDYLLTYTKLIQNDVVYYYSYAQCIDHEVELKSFIEVLSHRQRHTLALTHAQAHIHVHTHTHTFMHTHTHTHTRLRLSYQFSQTSPSTSRTACTRCQKYTQQTTTRVTHSYNR